MKKLIIPLILSTSLVGCASITQGRSQTIKVEAINQKGEQVQGASCVLRNDRGQYHAVPPGFVEVRRSGDDLQVTCQAPSEEPAEAKLRSSVSAAFFGNILFGGIPGMVIDGVSGAASKYPEYVRLEYGKRLIFARSPQQQDDMVWLNEKPQTAK